MRERPLRAEPAAEQPGRGPATSISDDPGAGRGRSSSLSRRSRSRPGRRRRAGQPARGLDEARYEHERAEHREPGDHRSHVRQQHRPLRRARACRSAARRRGARTGPRARADGREREQPEHRRATSTPSSRPPTGRAGTSASTTESSAAPGTSIRDGRADRRLGDVPVHQDDRDRDAGPPRRRTASASWRGRRSPGQHEPEAPPMPNTAERRPIPTLTRSGGNSSRMIPKLSGNTAPAAPETIRKAISVQMSGAAAQPMHPTRKTSSATTSSRSLPKRSPSLPRIGVRTAADSRKPVITQVTHVVDAPSSRWSSGSAGTTIVCWSAYAVAASVRIAEGQAVVLTRLRHIVTQRNDRLQRVPTVADIGSLRWRRRSTRPSPRRS